MTIIIPLVYPNHLKSLETEYIFIEKDGYEILHQ